MAFGSLDRLKSILPGPKSAAAMVILYNLAMMGGRVKERFHALFPVQRWPQTVTNGNRQAHASSDFKAGGDISS